MGAGEKESLYRAEPADYDAEIGSNAVPKYDFPWFIRVETGDLTAIAGSAILSFE